MPLLWLKMLWLPVDCCNLLSRVSLLMIFTSCNVYRHSLYNSHRSQPDGEVLEVPHVPRQYISLLSILASAFFACGAHKIWNDLPDSLYDIYTMCSHFSLFRQNLQKHTHHSFCLFSSFSLGTDSCYVCMIMDICFSILCA